MEKLGGDLEAALDHIHYELIKKYVGIIQC